MEAYGIYFELNSDNIYPNAVSVYNNSLNTGLSPGTLQLALMQLTITDVPAFIVI